MAEMAALVAHRGMMHRCPENTLIAFETALASGVHHLECDLQLSRDRVPIVIHDATLDRTTCASGSVFERTAAELTQVVANEPCRYPGRFPDAHLLTLAELVERLGDRSGLHLFAEVKRQSLRHFGITTTLAQVHAALAPASFAWSLISFDAELVEAVAGIATRGWILPDWQPETLERAARLAPDFLFIDRGLLPVGAELPRGRWRWVAYDIATRAEAEHLVARGFDLIESGCVDELLDGGRRRDQRGHG